LYGLTTAYGSLSTKETSFNYSAHTQTLSGLTAGTLYHFCVQSADQAGNLSTSGDYTFTTASTTSTSPTSSITSVAVSPTTLTLNPSAQTSFAATVAGTGTFSYGVTWSCLKGTITSGGLYTAPSAAGSDTVTATSVQDGSKKGTSSLTISSGSVVPSGTSVKSAPYNAYGDGVHDDTAAINACISAVNAAGGGTVIVPAGTFMINAVANSWYGVRVLSNVTLYLSSGAVLQCITNGVDNYGIVNLSGNNATITGPGTISGDRATHTGTTGEWGMGIYVGNTTATNCTISNVTVTNCWGDGIYVYETSGTTNLTITGVTCDNNRRQGMSIINVQGMTVTGSTFSNTHGTAPECGIDIEPNSPQIANNVNINHCTFTGNHGGAFQAGGAAGTTITNVVFDSNTLMGNSVAPRIAGDSGQANGIFIGYCYGQTSLANAIKITNNTLTGNYGEGIQFDHTTYGTCTGNNISGTINVGTYQDGGGIYLFDSDYITVTGNTITGNAGGGVWFVGPAATNTHNTITPNTFSGNGGANYPASTY
jgi:parallel beta-helix repeat protein